MQRPPQDDRDGQEGQPRQVADQHDEGGADQHDRRDQLQDLVRADVEEALQLVDVVVEHRQQPAGLSVLEEAHLEALHVGVRLEAQLVLDVLSQVPPEHPERVLEGRLEHPHHHGDRRQRQQLVARVRDAEAGRQERILRQHDDVDGRADQEGRREVEGLVEHRARGGGHQASAVPGGMPPQARERVARTRTGQVHGGPV